MPVFETDYPQLLVSWSFLTRNNISLESLGVPETAEYETASGLVAMHLYPRSCRVRVVELDKTSREVVADIVVSTIEKEVLLSDALVEELGMILLSSRTIHYNTFINRIKRLYSFNTSYFLY